MWLHGVYGPMDLGCLLLRLPVRAVLPEMSSGFVAGGEVVLSGFIGLQVPPTIDRPRDLLSRISRAVFTSR